MINRARLAFKVAHVFRDHLSFAPGGLVIMLPWFWLSLDVMSSGGVHIEVFEVPDYHWPQIYWEARFTPRSIRIGDWFCPSSPEEWLEQFILWVNP